MIEVKFKEIVKDKIMQETTGLSVITFKTINAFGGAHSYTREFLNYESFLVRDCYGDYIIIEPDEFSNYILAKEHVEPYYKDLVLDDSIFEWDG